MTKAWKRQELEDRMAAKFQALTGRAPFSAKDWNTVEAAADRIEKMESGR